PRRKEGAHPCYQALALFVPRNGCQAMWKLLTPAVAGQYHHGIPNNNTPSTSTGTDSERLDTHEGRGCCDPPMKEAAAQAAKRRSGYRHDVLINDSVGFSF
ncbi:unnamed protein product, partial [Ectocarpus sp. 12 AP-2014]